MCIGLPARVTAVDDEVGTVEDDVAIHWDWACERLSADRLARLVERTRRQLALTPSHRSVSADTGGH